MEFGPLASRNADNVELIQVQTNVESSLDGKTIKLEGHKDAITSARFSPDGQLICTGSRDKMALIWKGTNSCDFLGGFNTKSPIIDLQFHDFYNDDDYSQNLLLLTSQASGFISVWDLNKGVQQRRLGNTHSRKFSHRMPVNSLSLFPNNSQPNLVCSASDDKFLKIWDIRVNKPVCEYHHSFELTSCCAQTEDSVLFGSVDGCLYSLNITNFMPQLDEELSSKLNEDRHSDILLSISMSGSGQQISTCSSDKSMKLWNVQPFVPPNQSRLVGHFFSQFNNSEMDIYRSSINSEETLVAMGGSKLLFIWNIFTKKLIFALPGHLGNVTCAQFHPKDPNIILSGGNDALGFVNEIK
ncbi:MAG: hypothetical protein MHMPM18_001049 [Marteilia pararefringens]